MDRDSQRLRLLATYVRFVAAGLHNPDRRRELLHMAVTLEASATADLARLVLVAS